MKLRNRQAELDVDSEEQHPEDSDGTDSSDGDDAEPDSDLLELAKKIGSIVKAEIETPQKIPKSGKGKGKEERPLFVIDKTAAPSTSTETVLENSSEDESEKSDDESDEEEKDSEKSADEETRKDSKNEASSKPKLKPLTKKQRNRRNRKKRAKADEKEDLFSSSLQVGLNVGDLYLNTDPDNNPSASLKSAKSVIQAKSTIEKEILSQSVITSDFEKKHQVPVYQESLNQIKKKRREERGKTKGHKWFGMKAPEMTEEKKNDLMVLQYRRALDPKHFFKGPDTKATPKFFQMGKVVEDHSDFYSARIPKKQRKANLVEELLADAEFRQYNKRKYAEIVESKKQGKGAYRHMKRLKKRK